MKPVNGLIVGIDVGHHVEKEHQGKLLAHYGKYVTVYLTHAILASDALMAKRPQVLRQFLAAWFQTID